MLFIMLLISGGKMEAKAATYKLNITGSTSYYKVLDTILNNGNEARAAVGAPALVLDKELTETRTYTVEILDGHLNANAYVENNDNEIVYDEFVFGDEKTFRLMQLPEKYHNGRSAV